MMMYTDASNGRNMAKDPAVVNFLGNYFMYYSVGPSCAGIDGWKIGIAKSVDLSNWTKLCNIETDGELEASGMCAPGAIVIDNRVHLFYQTYGGWEKDAICHAYSDDGVHFTRNKTNPILRAKGDWNNGRAIDADVVIFNNELYLYFATRDPEGEIQMQGVSKCALDGKFERESFTQLCTGPILKPELQWEQKCIEAAATIVHNKKVYMFYAGAYNNWPQQVGVAESSDGVNFTRLFDFPFLPCGEPGSWNSSESGHPYVFEDNDGRIYLFYQGNCDNGNSWFLSYIEIAFKDGIPYIKKEAEAMA